MTRIFETGTKIPCGANASVMTGHSTAGASREIIATLFVPDITDIPA